MRAFIFCSQVVWAVNLHSDVRGLVQSLAVHNEVFEHVSRRSVWAARCGSVMRHACAVVCARHVEVWSV